MCKCKYDEEHVGCVVKIKDGVVEAVECLDSLGSVKVVFVSDSGKESCEYWNWPDTQPGELIEKEERDI